MIYRLILFWMGACFWQFALAVAILVFVAGLGLLLDTIARIISLSVVVGGIVVYFRHFFFQLFTIARATWRFRRLDSERVTLWYAPQLDERELAPQLALCTELLDEFSKRFGFPLKRRLVVILFDSVATMNSVYKGASGGYALVGGDAVVLGNAGLVGVTLTELYRHEVGHLFSWRLGPLDPPLKGEGLATFLQGSTDGKSLDFDALKYLLTDRHLHLTWLTIPGNFGTMNSYAVVGSFTAHLIERFGWERYLAFYRQATVKNFAATFASTFGLSLLTVERQWRDGLIARRPQFEPELSQFIGEANLMAAYEAGQLLRCLEVGESLRSAGPLSGRVLFYIAVTHGHLGHYQQAAELLEQAFATNDPCVRAWSGYAWLLLGEYYDLTDQRAKAVPAYERALAEPDMWTPWSASTHARARDHLRQPFEEATLQKELRQLELSRMGAGGA